MSHQITASQHYVPQTYLKHFISPEAGKLCVFDKGINKFTPPKSPAAVAKEDYFYGEKTGVPDDVSQVMEEWFYPFENLLGTDYPKMLESLTLGRPLNYYEHIIICIVVAHLLVRGKGLRRKLANMLKSTAKQIENLIPNASSYENLSTFFSDDNSIHLLMQDEVKGFFNTMTHKKVRIWKATGTTQFITTDSPVAEFVSPYTKFDTSVYHGYGIAELLHTLALSPRFFVELYHPNDLSGKQIIVRTASVEKVREINAIQLRHADRYAFGHSETDFWKDKPKYT